MKKLLFILFTILFTFPLFGQGFGYHKTYNKEQLKKFFSIDTVKTDDVYTVNYTLYIDRLMSDYSYNYNWHRYPYYNYWSYNYNWYYDDWYYFNYDYYWFYTHSWYYDNYHRYYGNYYYNNHYYKPRPHKPIRQRTIATTVRKDIKPQVDRKREYVRPVKTTETRYNRPASTYNPKSRTVRQSTTYNRPTRSSNNRSYTTPTRSNNNRSGSTTRSSSTNRSSSGSSKGRR